MAKTKYKKKPEFWYCLQYNGTNIEEMTEFCPECVYDTNVGKLIFANVITVNPSDWILEDNAGIFTMKNDSQFIAYFDLASGPETFPEQPA